MRIRSLLVPMAAAEHQHPDFDAQLIKPVAADDLIAAIETVVFARGPASSGAVPS
jgi:hypothetical protein